MHTYRDHVPVLDTLRGLAAALVVFTHIPSDLLNPPMQILNGALRPGYLAMEIFFVLSGFLITRILLSDRARGKPIRHYLIRRFLRIFPIYYLFLMVMLIWHPWEEVRWCFVYLSNFHYPFHDQGSHLRHTWSLCVEEHYYLLWAFAVYGLGATFCKWTARVGFVLIAVAATFITLQRLAPGEAKQLLYMGTMYRALGLALGSAFAFSEHALRERPRRAFALALGLIFLGQALAFVFLSPIPALIPELAGAIAPLRSPTLYLWFRMFAFTMVSGGVVLMCLSLRNVKGVLGAVLGCPPLQFVGKISYGWYLFHVPLFGWIFAEMGHDAAALLTAIGSSLVAATISYYAIERPILRLKTRFS